MDVITYLLKFFFDAIVMILILRVWLQLVQADFYNPISQFIVKVSNPIVIPLRRIIPGFGGIDLATVLLVYLFSVLEFTTFYLINGQPVDIPIVFYVGLLAAIKQVGFMLFVIMLIMAIMSWVVQGYNPTMMIFQQLTEPFLRPIRRLIPSIGGLDLSILVAFLLLNVVNIFLSSNLPYWHML